MAYNRNQARNICTKAEFELFESSLAANIGKLPEARLKNKLQRARTLRDKNRDLHKRQRLATRARTGTKKGVRADTNARTEQKAKLFAEVLQRFETRLAEVTAAGKKAAKKKATKKKVAKKKAARKKVAKKKAAKKKVARKKVSRKVSGKKSSRKKTSGAFATEKAAAASKRQRKQNTRSKAVMGHTKSATRRRQAKRDGGRR